MGPSMIVAVRLRPYTKQEILKNSSCPIQIPKPGVVRVNEPNNKSNNIREFRFDHTFWSLSDDESNPVPYADQELVYQTLGYPLLLKSLEGYNTCLLAYGMTSSGKTYSISGPPDDPGIIRRISKDLFKEVEKITTSNIGFSVKMSYYEIYNERIRDLLTDSAGNGLIVREHPVTGPYIDGLLHEEVRSESDISKRLDSGNRLRAVAPTPFNENSSRSHTVLVLWLTKRSTTKYPLGDIDNVYNSRITIVDLAGSERQTSTSTLSGRFIVITQLSQNTTSKKRAFPSSEPRSASQNTGPLVSVTPCRLINKQRDFVSYRDSLLTWLLKDSLGGNSITVMLTTISPCETHYDETLSTLRYAKKASSIVNSAIVNEDPKSRLIRELISELRKLQQKASSSVFESGTSQAYELAKLKELISIRKEGVLQLQRRLTNHRLLNENESTQFFTHGLCKSTQTSRELYRNETVLELPGSRSSLFNHNHANTVTPIRIHVDKMDSEGIIEPDVQTTLPSSSDISTLVGHSLLCSPKTHCQLVDQIAHLKCTIQSVQDSAKNSVKLEDLKAQELSQKVTILQEKLRAQTCLLDNFRQAFDRLNRNYQSTLQLFPHILRKVAQMTGPDNELNDITNYLVSSEKPIKDISESQYTK
ncbi:Kinesin-like protein KIF14 [Schistosoma japonicum]|nr:Kinesin-like protein KIF14 [Schistosoma japonicum]KAH8850756.1 Kinesin-like protein KIF14 [Schistosoma japonicum]KAH8850758.1 Kinesin-like protein KIF14 [Schistosoma japonicum]KAH8850759.1 Kinesin-like protein KIF14 [Schistosoma japonicum]